MLALYIFRLIRKHAWAFLLVLFFVLVLFLVPILSNWQEWKAKQWFQHQPLTVDDSPILINQIRGIGELITARAMDEVVVVSTKLDKGLIIDTQDELVLIAKGTVTAGINLSTLDTNAIQVKGDTIRLQLPEPVLLDTIVNPTDVTPFIEEGEWPPKARQQLIQQARQKMAQRAIDRKLLVTARTQAQVVISQLLASTGKIVIVQQND
jgi:energy-coupling factor transporter transmembrane protein EcfT